VVKSLLSQLCCLLNIGYVGRCLFPDGVRSPNKKDRHFKQRDAAAFGSPIDSTVLEEDFDFEKNLALFNKQVNSKING
jgi:hypothetical protein